MYNITVDDLGYFRGWDNKGQAIYGKDIYIINDEEDALASAKIVNKETGQRVWVYKMVEENYSFFPATKLTLKDLKRGETFQYLTNPDCVFMVVSDKEIVCVKGDSFRYIGQFFNITESTKNDEVKKVKL